jgi:hypothetical protein
MTAIGREACPPCLKTDDIYDSRKFVSNTRLSGDRV